MATTRMLLNKPANPPRPDYCFADWEGKLTGISRKQGGEFAGAIDATEYQLLEEMQEVEHLGLLIEGWVTPSMDGGCQCWIQRETKTGTAYFQGQTLHTSYKAMQGKLASFRAAGVDVIWTSGEYETAVALTELYQWSQKPESEHQTFNRLIKEKYVLDEVNLRKRDMALILANFKGVGAERALAITDDFESIAKLWPWLTSPENMKYVASLPLRGNKPGGRKMTVGPAAVASIRKGLGL